MKTPIGMLGAFGAAAVLAGAKATKMASELELAMREVSTLLPQTVEDMGELRDAVIELSTRVPAPPVQLTKGLYQVISAGVTDTAEAMDVLEISTKAATAGMAESADAVRAITTVINAYGLEASEAERISDAFFVAIAQGVTRFPELAASIGNVATSAGQAGLEVEEMTAALATLTKAGLSTEEAATSLNRLLFSLIQNTPEAKEAAEAMGAEFDLAALQAKGLSGFLHDLRAATDGEIDALAKINPSIRSLRALLVLAGNGLDEFDSILEASRSGIGATEIAFEKMNTDLSNQWKILKNNVNTIWLKLGNVTLPIVTSAMGLLNRTLSENEEILDRMAAGRISGAALGGLDVAQLQTAIAGARATLDELMLSRGELADEGASAFARRVHGMRSGGLQLFLQELEGMDLEIHAAERRVQDLEEALSRLGGVVAPPPLAQEISMLEGNLVDLDLSFIDLDNSVQQFLYNLAASNGEFETIQQLVASFTKDLHELAVSYEELQEAMDSDRIADANRDVEALVHNWAMLPRSVQNNVLTLTAVRQRLAQVGLTVDDLIPALREFIKQMEGGEEGANGLSENLGDMTAEALRAGRALLNAARAAGVFESDTAAAISAALDLAESIKALQAAQAAGTSLVTPIAGIAGAVLALGSMFFGGNAKAEAREKKRQETLEENNARLRELRDVMGSAARVLRQAPGGLIQAGISGLRPTTEGKIMAGRLSQALEAAGFSHADLWKLAEDMGITLDHTREGLTQFWEALKALEADRLFETFAGQMDLMRREFELFDETDPAAKLGRVLEVLKNTANLGSRLDFDINTEEGRRALQATVESLFTSFTQGGLSLGALGQLTATEFLDVLGLIETLLDEFDNEEAVAKGVTRGFQVSRTITEVTGNRLVGTMTTVAFWAERAAIAGEAQLAFLTGSLEPPTTSAMCTFAGNAGVGGAEATVLCAPITINFGDIILSGVTNPEQAAHEIAGRVREQVDEVLGGRMLDTRRARGLAQPNGLRN